MIGSLIRKLKFWGDKNKGGSNNKGGVLLSDTLNKGDMFYYPSSIDGMADLFEYISCSEQDVLVGLADIFFFIPKSSVNSHGVKVDSEFDDIRVSQIIEDPDNSLVYIRYRWDHTFVDRMYNWYCNKRGRQDTIGPISPEKKLLQ